MVESTVNFLFEKLTAFLTQEASLPRGVRHEVEEIKLELDSMRPFVRDADRRKDIENGVKNWVMQVRYAAYDVDDIIDEFLYHMDRPQRGGIKVFLLNAFRLHWNNLFKFRFAARLKGVKSQIIMISEKKALCNLSRTEEGSSLNTAEERWSHHKEASFYLEDDEIVGLDEGADQLVRWLTDDEPQRTAISVVGMGGLGKTTLVAKVFRNKMVKKHFDCFLWLSVSQAYRTEELLRSVIKDLYQGNKAEVPHTVGSMNTRQLVQMVNGYLAARRYVLVLDDVWSIDAWTDLSVAFPKNVKGSRIMLTTRNENVAASLGEGSSQYQLHPLRQQEAWKLFCRKAFWSGTCPPELEPLAQTIVQKCEGLPLAIVAVASLLSLKEKTASEWNQVCANLSWLLGNNQMLEPIKHILLLSFYDLPYRLKYCFLYCCMFPEDFVIYRKQLIRLWVSEGFVEERGRTTVEEVAEDYLQELIHRNLLQVAIRNEYGRVRACRVHDITRDVAMSLSDEEKFCITYDGQQAIKDSRIRRMSVYSRGDQLKSNTASLHLRSVLVFDSSMSFPSSLDSLVSHFKLLRVLNLEGLPVETVPDALTDLFNLRYLNLGKTKIRKLPKSLEKLHNLETLDVRHTMMKKLPSGMVKLQKLRNLFNYRINDEYSKNFDYFRGTKKLDKLRHLFSHRVNEEYLARFDYHSGIQVPSGICSMTSLHSLSDIELNDDEIAKQIGNLTQLRSFGVSKVQAAQAAELCHSIGKLEHLRSLGVKAITEGEPLQLENICPPLLQKLYLNAHLEKVPQSFQYLVNLTHLWLRWSQMSADDPLSSLHSLPNLVFLELWKAYEGQQLVFPNGCFPKLKKLNLWDLTRLNWVVIEKGAMPCIQELDLARCGELRMLPQGIEHLTELQELFLDEMPRELVERLRCKDENDENRQKVGHIPIIKYEFWTEEDGWVVERLD